MSPNPKLHRCAICDESYNELDPESMRTHQHPEPQSGPPRDLWLASKLPYDRWITETDAGRAWVECGRTGYDSRQDTIKHIGKVQTYLTLFIGNLFTRSHRHDLSKLFFPEKEAFDSLGPTEVLAKLVYGSPEYTANLSKIKPAIDHHYAVNDHHPEHFKLWRCPACGQVYRESDLKMTDHGNCQACLLIDRQVQLEAHISLDGMSLMGLIEMLADWKAASERHITGDIKNSLAQNRARFHIGPQLQHILENTLRECGWLK